MPIDYTDCAYMPEPVSGEHYTLVPVAGDARAAFGPVGDFAAAVLTKGLTHLWADNRIVVKLPGSFTLDTDTDTGLVDKEVYNRGPIWENKDLVEVEGNDDTPVLRNGRMSTIEHEVFVSAIDKYTDTTTHEPLTIVACQPGFVPDDEEFTESMSEMQTRLEKEMDDDRMAQCVERIRPRQADQSKVIAMDTTLALTDPAAIPSTKLHVVPPEGTVMQDFSQSGKVAVDLTQCTGETASTGNTGGPATQPQGATGSGRAGTAIGDAELAAELNMFQCLDAMCKNLNLLEGGYFQCVDKIRKVIREVSSDLDALENAYVVSVMAALAKWQQSGIGALQAMHMANAREWDAHHTELIAETVKFRNECMEADTTQIQGLSDLYK